jgi:hypothetical protein
MYWILIALATNSYMGTYTTERDCQNAIRERLIAEIIPASMQRAYPEMRKSASAVVDKTIQFQSEYQCLPKGVDK